MKIIEEKKTILIILFILFLLIPFLFAYFLSRQSPQPIKSRAQESVNFCQDKCTGFDRCSQSSEPIPSDPNYNDPCCEEIRKTGDPGACPWPQRGYCTDAQCASIPPDVNRQRCGGPRNVWCNLCRDNKCPGYVSSPPTVTQAPFIPSKPTTIPVFPTTIIPFLPTEEPPPPLPTSPPFELKLPRFIVPSVNINIEQVNRAVEKPLGFFQYVFERITYYDRMLENGINIKIKSLFK